VLGKVGDGKSSLLSAILGEMHRCKGDLTVRGRTAYFVQGGWCMGSSIRDK
jgi:ABC-type molybdenum transport system ATPase subunit/photorepair protein PhrA